jgi:diamine N-acetyltransferase
VACVEETRQSVIRGERVNLRPVRESDIEMLFRWGSDAEIVQWAGKKFDTEEEARDWYLSVHHLQKRSWIIETSDGYAIGEVEMANISWRLHTGELRIVIGEKSMWNQGYGQDAIRTCIRGLFGSTSLNEVFLKVDRQNLRALNCYQKVGFRVQGRVRLKGDEDKPRSILLMRIVRKDLEHSEEKGA